MQGMGNEHTPCGDFFRPGFPPNQASTRNENGSAGKFSSRLFHGRVARRLHSPRCPENHHGNFQGNFLPKGCAVLLVTGMRQYRSAGNRVYPSCDTGSSPVIETPKHIGEKI